MISSYSKKKKEKEKQRLSRTRGDKKNSYILFPSDYLFGVEKRGREIIFGGDNLSVAIERRHFSSGLSLVQVHSWRARTGVRRITRPAAYAHIYIHIYICIYLYIRNIYICMDVCI